MSYLDSPRIHFRGWFQADVSTINNDVRFFQDESFLPAYQELNANGSWNPKGTGVFRILDCYVTGGFLDGRSLSTPADDPVIGLTIQNANDRPPGKLVDLDPQQQMVSQIWGMQVRLAGADEDLFRGDYKAAAFTNLWFRQQSGVKRDQQLCAYYQSVIENVVWSKKIDSRLIEKLKRATRAGMLSINFNVYGYGRDSTIPRYTMGHLVGTIGPYLRGEPKHFVRGRHMLAYFGPGGSDWPKSDSNVNSLQAKLATFGRSLTVDFGNSFPIVDASGAPTNIGQVQLGVLRTNPQGYIASVGSSEFVLIGDVPYLDEAWYTQSAAVQTFDLSKNTPARTLLRKRPLVLVTPLLGDPLTYKVLLQESINGMYVRADSFVYRLNPGETQKVEFYATQFGESLTSNVISINLTEGFMGGSGSSGNPVPPLNPPAAIPANNTPPEALSFAMSGPTNSAGRATLNLIANAAGPGNARGYIAGQLYGVGYQLADQPRGYISNPLDYVSVHVYDQKDIPDHPTWYQDIRQLFTQYGNLYPIMSKYVVDLTNYDAVVDRVGILQLAFSLPIEDPNYMPVTRDLAEGDRQTILKWFSSPGPDGKPLLGTPPPKSAFAAQPTPPLATTPATEGIELEPLQGGGKTAFILQYAARQRAKSERESGGEK